VLFETLTGPRRQLQARGMPELTGEEVLHRVLLRAACERGSRTRGNCEGKSERKAQDEFWSKAFRKYDADNSGLLSIDEIRKMVRKDLRMGDQLIPDEQLQQLFSHIDADSNKKIDWYEFTTYVQRTQKVDKRSQAEVLMQLGRATRLALRRNKVKTGDLEEMFRSFLTLDCDCPLDGALKLSELRRFFREVLKVSKHDVSDETFGLAFQYLDKSSSNSVNTEEFLDLIPYFDCSQFKQSDDGGGSRVGLVSGAREVYSKRAPRQRVASLPGAGAALSPSKAPFCLNGRSFPSSSRLAAASATEGHQLSQQLSRPPSRDRLVRSLSGTAPGAIGAWGQASQSLMDRSGTLPPSSPAVQAVARPGTAPAAQGAKARDATGFHPGVSTVSARSDAPAASRPSTAPGRGAAASPSYRILRGGTVLNRVEQRLMESGVDVRGGFYRHA